MRTKSTTLAICLLVALTLLCTAANACSTFILKNEAGEIVFGHNFDFPSGLGYVTENKRDVQKTALAAATTKKMEWTSKYGSISFNQFGAEFPYGGMNEAGLVIEQMWLKETSYPPEDERYHLSALQWIQYQLDMSASIDEIVQSDAQVSINSRTGIKLHFLVCDKNGDTATIEFINGKMVTHLGDSLPVQVLTNNSYQSGCEYLKQFTDFGGTKELKFTPDTYDRFATIAHMLKSYDQKIAPVDYAFDILKSVTGSDTRWSIVYDLTNKKIYFKTKENVQLRSFKMASFDFNNKKPRLNLNVDAPLPNAKQAFIPYSSTENLKHISTVYGSLEMFKGITQNQIEIIARYPESLILK